MAGKKKDKGDGGGSKWGIINVTLRDVTNSNCRGLRQFWILYLSPPVKGVREFVICLPGCFSIYCIWTADKGRPIIISNRIIDEYAEPHVDALHKKNLFSLGEDRFLTTLLLKHFPTFKTKFCPDAVAHTIAPESWGILFSQKCHWINSTVHNLLELVILPELFGFCCFSMRFFVFIDLLGTLVRPQVTRAPIHWLLFNADPPCNRRVCEYPSS